MFAVKVQSPVSVKGELHKNNPVAVHLGEPMPTFVVDPITLRVSVISNFTDKCANKFHPKSKCCSSGRQKSRSLRIPRASLKVKVTSAMSRVTLAAMADSAVTIIGCAHVHATLSSPRWNINPWGKDSVYASS